VAGLNDAIAKPTHAPCMFNAIFKGVAEPTIDVRSDSVSVEQDRFQHGSEGKRQRRFARAGKSHDQNFAVCGGFRLAGVVRGKKLIQCSSPTLLIAAVDAIYKEL
jgi:hypothetical protein